MKHIFPEPGSAGRFEGLPLVIDLDGTLLRSDLLIETLFALLGRRPGQIFRLLGALLRGRAAFKAFIADNVQIDPALLPYDEAVLAEIRSARADNRCVLLVSASNQRYVARIAQHLGLFDAHHGSTETNNLSGSRKAAMLVDSFGVGGFDYIGNSSADLRVWASANRAVAIRTSRRTAGRVRRLDPNARFLEHSRPSLRTWAKMLRVHQWAKNALIGVPLLTSHKFELGAMIHMITAFVAFSLCASGVYIINDQVDLAADRAHRSKRHRPLAAGLLSLHWATATALLLFVLAALAASSISWQFVLVLGTYLTLTSGYSLVFKRKMIVDLVILAMLYTVRVVGGAVAISVPISEWLLAFSMFIFLSLALVKRYVDLAALRDGALPDPVNRNYRVGDIEIIGALAAAAGFNATTVLALWISSSEVRNGYARPQLLWLICPLVLYWIGRVLMMAHRRLMDDDPIVFALRDRNSLVTVILVGLIMLVAI